MKTKTAAKPAFELILTRVVDAPRERVFAAWSEPAQIARWFAPSPYTLPKCEMDFRSGGKFSMAMRSPEGEEHPFTGTYREVVKPSRIVWSGEFPDGPKEQMLTEVDFEAQGNKTKLTVRQTFSVLTPETAPRAKGAKQGWTMTLDQLAAHCEGSSDREIVVSRLIDAPVARVWRAWTDNAEIVKWWGPHGFSDETSAREFKPGGHWKHTMIGPDGARFPNYATYKEIEENKRIVLINAGSKEDAEKGVGFRAEITFKAVGNKTEITMRNVFPTAEMRAHVVKEFKAIEGGHQTLSRLAARVEGDFVIFRMIDAPRERVWRAWTTEKELAAWMGPKGAELGHAKLDFRVGGSYHYSNKFNGVEMWGLATYEEIDEPAKIVFLQQFSDKDRGLGVHPMSPTWPKRLRTTVHLQDFGAKTLISLYWKPVDPTEIETKTFTAAMDGMKGGWGGSFDRLDEFLKS